MKFFNKIISFLIFSLFITMSTQNLWADNNQDNKINNILIKRVILKTINETVWSYLKENKKNSIDYYELGKIWSNYLVEEFIPEKDYKLKDKYIELLTPIIISSLVSNYLVEKKVITPKKGVELFQKILTKLLLVKFFYKPETYQYKIFTGLAFILAFLDFNSKYYINPYTGIEKISLAKLENLLDSIKFDNFLDKKCRKKALSKTGSVLLKPVIHKIIFFKK